MLINPASHPVALQKSPDRFVSHEIRNLESPPHCVRKEHRVSTAATFYSPRPIK